MRLLGAFLAASRRLLGDFLNLNLDRGGRGCMGALLLRAAARSGRRVTVTDCV